MLTLVFKLCLCHVSSAMAPVTMQDFDPTMDAEITQLMRQEPYKLINMGTELYKSSSIAIEECFDCLNRLSPSDSCHKAYSTCCCYALTKETQALVRSLELARIDLQDKCIIYAHSYRNDPLCHIIGNNLKLDLVKSIYNFKILQDRVLFRRRCLETYCCCIGCALCCCLCKLH